MRAGRRSTGIGPGTIEGEAIVVERAAIPAAKPAPRAPPINDNRPMAADALFLNRPHRPDLVFQGARKGPVRTDPPRPNPYEGRAAALGADTVRREAGIALLLASLASIAAFSAPDLAADVHPRSTPGVSSSTTDRTEAAPDGGKTDRITVTR